MAIKSLQQIDSTVSQVFELCSFKFTEAIGVIKSSKPLTDSLRNRFTYFQLLVDTEVVNESLEG